MQPRHTLTFTGNHKSRAFTLLELIVVLVVLGLLAAIAIPTYQNIIDTAAVTAQVQRDKAIARRITAGALMRDGSTNAEIVAAALSETEAVASAAPGEYAVEVNGWDAIEDTGSRTLAPEDGPTKFLWKVESPMMYTATRYDTDTVVFCHASLIGGWANCKDFSATGDVDTDAAAAAPVEGPGGAATTTTTAPPSGGEVMEFSNGGPLCDFTHSDMTGAVLVCATMNALVGADTDNLSDVYTFTVATDTFELISAATTGDAFTSAISPDGRYVVYSEYDGSGNFTGTLHIYDRTTDTEVTETGATWLGSAINNSGQLAFISATGVMTRPANTDGAFMYTTVSDAGSLPDVMDPMHDVYAGINQIAIADNSQSVVWLTAPKAPDNTIYLARSVSGVITLTDIGADGTVSPYANQIKFAANGDTSLVSFLLPSDAPESLGATVHQFDAINATVSGPLVDTYRSCKISVTAGQCGNSIIGQITTFDIPSGTETVLRTPTEGTVELPMFGPFPEYFIGSGAISGNGNKNFYIEGQILDPDLYASSWFTLGTSYTLYSTTR